MQWLKVKTPCKAPKHKHRAEVWHGFSESERRQASEKLAFNGDTGVEEYRRSSLFQVLKSTRSKRLYLLSQTPFLSLSPSTRLSSLYNLGSLLI